LTAYEVDALHAIDGGRVLLTGLGFDSPTHLSEAFVSSDQGVTWAAMAPSISGTVDPGGTILDSYVLQGWSTGVFSDPPPDPLHIWDWDYVAEKWTVTSLTWNQVEGPGSVILAGGFLVINAPPFAGQGQTAIWRSTDGGSTWQTVLNWPYSGAGPSSIALTPSGEALAVLDVGLGYGTNHRQTLYKSTDAGSTWTVATNPGPTDNVTQAVLWAGNNLMGGKPCP